MSARPSPRCWTPSPACRSTGTTVETVYLWGRQLRTGGYFARSELFGGLEESFGTSYFYQSGGRLVMDVQGLLWKLEYVGVGAGYFWSDRFSGWTIGAEISFAF